MTEPVAITAQDDKVGPGRLVLVVGPSGAGKDTLIDLAKRACRDDPCVAFPRRIVTRASSSAEDNDTLTPEAFVQAVSQNAFAVHWQAHGHFYGIPKTVDDELRAGRCVVVNVSRAVVSPLRAAYGDVQVVLVTAPPDVLAHRLAARGRASDGVLSERLHRASEGEVFQPDVTIFNVGPANEHLATLLKVLQRA